MLAGGADMAGKKVCGVGCLGVALVWAASVQAAWLEVKLAYDDFGHLENEGPKCVPTATVNSFFYLQKKYPTIYDQKLIPGGDMVKARNALFGYMNGDDVLGVRTFKDWWEGKVKWMEEKAPGLTIYDGMVNDDITGWTRGSVLEKGFPTFDFLWKELSDGEDVEFRIVLTGGGHALTLTSLKFDDLDGDKKWDWDPDPKKRESAKIDYLDPNKPTQLFETDLWKNADGSLGFLWDNTVNPAVNVYVNLAYSESPIPEPASLIVWSLLGAIGVTAGYWRRRRAA